MLECLKDIIITTETVGMKKEMHYFYIDVQHLRNKILDAKECDKILLNTVNGKYYNIVTKHKFKKLKIVHIGEIKNTALKVLTKNEAMQLLKNLSY